MASGLAALMISTCLLNNLLHAEARVLIGPHAPSARLLPINDNAARVGASGTTDYVPVMYFGIANALSTMAVAGEWSQIARDLMLIVCASVLSVLIWPLTQVQRHIARPQRIIPVSSGASHRVGCRKSDRLSPMPISGA